MATDTGRKDRRGRPTDFKVEFSRQAFHLCLLGATDKELAAFFEVSESTINLWKQRHKSFSDSLKEGRDEADANVGKRLYERACGFSHKDVDIRTVSIGDGMSKIVQTPIIKHYPPDTTACIFWLKNRQPAKWRDAIKVEHGGSVEVTHSTAADLRAELARRGITNPILAGGRN